MPKKHQPSFLSIKPTASTAPPRPTQSNPTPPPTVNERISQLRREQAPRATPERIHEVTEVVQSHRTVPPQLRRLLSLPEVDAPLPKTGRRRPPLRDGERPPPGPAAPTSWLAGSRHAPAELRRRGLRGGDGGSGVRRFCRLARVHDEEFKRLPPPQSLRHYCLRTFALNWEYLAEFEQHYLSDLPPALKEALLSYLSVYGQKGCLDSKSFKILFHGDEKVDRDWGSEEIRFLDLSGLLNKDYTLKDLEKTLPRPRVRPRCVGPADVTSSMGDLSLTPSSANKKGEKTVLKIPEAWEDEFEDFVPEIPPIINIPFFRGLTRLSLAHPGPFASWADLLAISPHLATLTHLSLAYWPRPSTTPNAATASMVSRHATVSLGGSHLYSELDGDWHEAANILRRLSLNTYGLKYLDLEGCTWIKALTWGMDADNDPEDWIAPAASPGPDWNTAWRQISHIYLFQGWIPADRATLQGMPAGVIAIALMSWLRDDEKMSGYEHLLEKGRSAGEVARWVERENVAWGVMNAIQKVRRRAGGKWVEGEAGWGGKG
ncbi:hypothetical protein K458DRAFT_281950, partial [Lentithecium fluviatile CBS 122367]